MKKLSLYLLLVSLCTGISSCDKDFEQVNTNPVLATTLDAAYLFSNAEFSTTVISYDYQQQIVQQLVTPYTGVREGGNHNVYYDPNSSVTFNYLFNGTGSGNNGPVKFLTDVINQTKNVPARSNLYNMARIWKAFVFQVLVDTYGDVPYKEAGLGFLEGINLPKYDPQQEIYNDLLKEVDEATKALDPAKPTEQADVFYKGSIPQWKKLGNSILLRLAMRLTKVDEAKAKQYAAIAATGGVMQTSADNAFLQYNTTFNHPNAGFFQGTERANVYVAQPFVDYLKATADPRLPVIAVKYQFGANPLATAGTENTNPADQNGMPMGYNENTMSSAPGFPGKTGAAYNYSMLNRRTVAKIDATEFFVTAGQTQLLLAEAAQRGYITGSAATFYNAGVRAALDQMKQFDPLATISPVAQDAYLAANPFNAAKAFEQINTQYWVNSFMNGSEAWANFRRSGYPALTPNPYPSADPAVKGGFVRRLIYPLREKSVNTENYNAAVARQGPDNLATRVFWDK